MHPQSDARIEGQGRNELVLVCGDGAPATLAMGELLRRAGFRVAAATPVEVYEVVRVQRPAVVVMRLDGDRRRLGLVDILRGDPLGQRTSIVVTSGAGTATHADARRAGANASFHEPVRARTFLRRIERLAGVPRRIALDVPLTLRKLRAADEGADSPIAARTLDASETGILLDASAPLDVDASYLVEARVSRGDFVLRARVVRRAAERGPGCFGIAFQHAPRLMRHAVAAIHDATRRVAA